jgi:hypothetical protein
MSNSAYQYYGAYYKLKPESEGKPERYCVRISLLPRVIKTETNELSNNYVEKYKTPFYEYSQEAFAHAYGWVDCGLFNQADPVDEGDFLKKAYSKARDGQDRLSNPGIFQEELTEVLKKQKEEKWEETLGQAYTEGWDAYKEGGEKKLIDGDVDD